VSREPDRAVSPDRDATLVEAFWAVERRLRRASRESLARWDVTPAQARALRTISRHGTMRLSALSDHLGIAARSGTEVVDGLEAKGLLLRRADPGDRRATLAELTDDGRRLLAAMRSARGSAAEQLFDRLSDTDRARLARILRKLNEPPATAP